eukprot:3882792-Rhodomonas_salina.13
MIAGPQQQQHCLLFTKSAPYRKSPLMSIGPRATDVSPSPLTDRSRAAQMYAPKSHTRQHISGTSVSTSPQTDSICEYGSAAPRSSPSTTWHRPRQQAQM